MRGLQQSGDGLRIGTGRRVLRIVYNCKLPLAANDLELLSRDVAAGQVSQSLGQPIPSRIGRAKIGELEHYDRRLPGLRLRGKV